MERKHIDIAGMNFYKGPWIHTRPANNFKFIVANGVEFAITENNYYLDTKTDKIKYIFQDCTNASYKHLYGVYMQVYPGIFAYVSIATENNLSDVMTRYAKIYHDMDYPNNPDVETWRTSLVRKN